MGQHKILLGNLPKTTCGHSNLAHPVPQHAKGHSLSPVLPSQGTALLGWTGTFRLLLGILARHSHRAPRLARDVFPAHEQTPTAERG